MDIDLLSKMVMELLVERDTVSLPGVGIFVSEQAPATFSDNGYSINPPYKKVSFRQRESDDDSLVEHYAKTCSIDKEVASSVLKEFLDGMVEVLTEKKVIIFPGLGLLRATKENHYFFVPDADDEVNADSFGLSPISLKSRVPVADVKPAPVEVPQKKSEPEGESGESRSNNHPFRTFVIVLLTLIVAGAALLRILGSFSPETVDLLLYNEEEYSLIHSR